MFEKFGISLAALGSFEVHIIGYPTSSIPEPRQNIFFHPIADTPFTRMSLKRVSSPWRILQLIRSIRPEILIITTHELLFMAAFARLFTSCKLLYDVQENYFKNVLHTSSLPIIVRYILAGWIRCKELITSPCIHHFILAEEGYLSELEFAKPYVILQNKIPKEVANTYRKKVFTGYSTILFSGTLAESTGVFNAIEIVKGLHSIDPSVQLIIIGSSHVPAVIERLQLLAHKHSFLQLNVQAHPVPHKDILIAIQQADFGIIYYPSNPATASSLPTKLYEYIALNLPILIHHTKKSYALIAEHQAGIILPEQIDYPALIGQMKSFKPVQTGSGLYWDTEFLHPLAVLNK